MLQVPLRAAAAERRRTLVQVAAVAALAHVAGRGPLAAAVPAGVAARQPGAAGAAAPLARRPQQQRVRREGGGEAQDLQLPRTSR